MMPHINDHIRSAVKKVGWKLTKQADQLITEITERASFDLDFVPSDEVYHWLREYFYESGIKDLWYNNDSKTVIEREPYSGQWYHIPQEEIIRHLAGDQIYDFMQ